MWNYIFGHVTGIPDWLTDSREQNPSWESNRSSASQEIPRIFPNPNVHYLIHKRPPPIVSQSNSIQPPQPNSWRSNLILSSPLCLGLPIGFFPLGFPTKTLDAHFPTHPLQTCHAPCPSPSWFCHPNNMWWGIQITKLFVMQSFPLSCHLALSGPNIFCSTLFSNTFTLPSSLKVRNQVSHACKKAKL